MILIQPLYKKTQWFQYPFKVIENIAKKAKNEMSPDDIVRASKIINKFTKQNECISQKLQNNCENLCQKIIAYHETFKITQTYIIQHYFDYVILRTLCQLISIDLYIYLN